MRITNKKKVLEDFCGMMTSLGEKIYRLTGESYERDCFCELTDNDSCFQFSDFIIGFVRESINEKLKSLLPIEEQKVRDKFKEVRLL